MIYPRPVQLFFMFSILIVSCTERIDIKLDESYVRLVVDGAITTDTMAHTILLSKSTSYFYNQPAPLVTGAQVKITNGKFTYDLNEEMPGEYRTEPSVSGVAGETYTLNIKLASPIGGFTDYKAISTLYPVSPLDSVELVFHSDWSTDGIWEVKCFVQDPPTIDFYRFMILRNGKMVTDTLDEWFVTDDRFFNGNYAYGAPVAYLEKGSPDEDLNPGDKVTVEMNSIGKDYANFLMQAQSELRGSNPLFSGPPANVIGNINNGAAGFFGAYSVSRAYTFVPKDIIKGVQFPHPHQLQ
jgi:hypothetical protein